MVLKKIDVAGIVAGNEFDLGAASVKRKLQLHVARVIRFVREPLLFLLQLPGGGSNL